MSNNFERTLYVKNIIELRLESYKDSVHHAYTR